MGSKPHNPNTTAISVACPTPVKERDPYRCTSTCSKLAAPPLSSISSNHQIAARHGPNVWELEGPTPIFNISKILMLSIFYMYLSKKFKLPKYTLNPSRSEEHTSELQ